ncbi:gamma-mobile-trio protein GmtX [Sagittula sp.]|uniref:gamma-mobile-trio protein GmtX n=1 Tax=Sagittula sp. TaxID=2038081 RepID=UPI0035183489
MNDITATSKLHEDFPAAYALYVQIRRSTRNTKKKNGLDNLWEVLGRQHVAKSSDFTVATIGSQTAKLGGPTSQTIRNANGQDYKAIINAFAQEAGGVTKGKLPKPNSDFEIALSSIDDRTTRHMVRLILQENKSLRNENNLLKNTIANEAPPIQTAPAHAPLKVPYLAPSLISAIREFLSPSAMHEKGWIVNEHGAIMDFLGNEIAPVGLHDALAQIVGNQTS